MAVKKKILFVDSDAGIQEIVQEQIAEGLCSEYEIKLALSIDEALAVLTVEKFDGVVIDGLEATLEKRMLFIKNVRIMLPKQSILALISTADFGLNSEEKKSLLEAKVSVANKVCALSYNNIKSLFDASSRRGFGEEICFQEDTQS